MLPYIRRRPISVVRCPDGPGAACFFQKHATAHAIPGIDTTLITESGGGVRTSSPTPSRRWSGCADEPLELHAWGAMAGAIERPDTLVLDLDPDPGLEWSKVVAGARLTRALLNELGLESLVKTTGGKGSMWSCRCSPGTAGTKSGASRSRSRIISRERCRAVHGQMAKTAAAGKSSSTTCATAVVQPQLRPTRACAPRRDRGDTARLGRAHAAAEACRLQSRFRAQARRAREGPLGRVRRLRSG